MTWRFGGFDGNVFFTFLGKQIIIAFWDQKFNSCTIATVVLVFLKLLT